MKPSSFSTSAMRTFSLDEGDTTSAWRARMALRMRARKSAIGSVMIPHLPARFDDAGDVTLQGEPAETDAAHLELPQESTRAPALLATVPVTHLPLRWRTMQVDGLCHDYVLNGIPRWRSSARPCSSVRALVVKVMFMPFGLSKRSLLISGKMMSSLITSV